MAPTFVSPNQWPIFENWLMIRKDGFRYVLLKDARGLTCRSTRHVQIVDMTDPSDEAVKGVAKKEVDYVCTETAISRDKSFSDEACRQNMEFFVPLAQSYLRMTLPKNGRLFAILGRFAGEATVKAVDDKGKERARLSVTVAETIKVPATFFRVRHLSGGRKPFVPHSKSNDEPSTRAGLSLANGMLRQAAIKVEIRSFSNADVALDLGRSVDVRKPDGPEVLAIRAKGARTAPNVFIAGRVLNNSGSTGSTLEDRDIIIDDHESGYDFARTLAHEFGHVFGLDELSPDMKKLKRVSQTGNVTKFHQPSTENLMGPGDEEGLKKSQIARMRERARVLARRGR